MRLTTIPANCFSFIATRRAKNPALEFSQIQDALHRSSCAIPAVLAIPVRMMEAWLLFHEVAIRQAAGSPRGKVSIDIPKMRDCEEIADPKARLHQCLRDATEARGRRLKSFNTDRAIHRLAELIPDYSPLRGLSAFQRLESDLREVLERNRWI